MFIGYNAIHGSPFDEVLPIQNGDKFEFYHGLIDEIYVDEDTEREYTLVKPKGWTYTTILNAKFQNSLEAGSVQAGDMTIEEILIQKRRTDTLEWHDFALLEYNEGEREYHEILDKYVANDFEYQYSIVPIAGQVRGDRVASDSVLVEFDGVFISDKENNYHMIGNIEFDSTTHNKNIAILEPMSSKFPIVVQSEHDYETLGFSGLFLSPSSIGENNNSINQMDIKTERLGKDSLFKFLKNGKPKVYRSHHGTIKLVMLSTYPQETPSNILGGLARVHCEFVEIGEMTGEDLKYNNMLIGFDKEVVW